MNKMKQSPERERESKKKKRGNMSRESPVERR
jgi:hypothetical protein